MTDTGISFPKKSQETLEILSSQQRLANGLLFYGEPGAFLKDATHRFVSLWQQKHEPELKQIVFDDPDRATTDVIQINEEKKIKIDHIKTLQSEIKYGPHERSMLFVIIHRCDQMTTEAANAFLKTLEDPPDQTCFILFSYDRPRLLRTILSRCQSYYFPKSTLQHVQAYAKHHFNKDADPSLIPKQYPRLIAAIQTQTLPNTSYLTYQELKNASPVKQLAHINEMSSNKIMAKTHLYSWIEELLNQTTPPISILTQLVDTLRYIDSNTNTKLLLESALISTP